MIADFSSLVYSVSSTSRLHTWPVCIIHFKKWKNWFVSSKEKNTFFFHNWNGKWMKRCLMKNVLFIIIIYCNSITECTKAFKTKSNWMQLSSTFGSTSASYGLLLCKENVFASWLKTPPKLTLLHSIIIDQIWDFNKLINFKERAIAKQIAIITLPSVLRILP